MNERLESIRRLLGRIPFRYKLVFGPALAAVAFVIIVFLSFVLGSRNSNLMEDIEQGYFPALSMSYDLERELKVIQEGFKDAAAASDLDFLAQVDEARERFLGALDGQMGNSVLEGELELTVGTDTKVMAAGSVAVIPPDVPHSGIARSCCRVMDIYHPPRDDLR